MEPDGTPLAPDVAARPSKATSLAVSKPSPKRTPSGYMCQLLRMSLSAGFSNRASRPRLLRNSSRLCSSYAPPRETLAEHPVDVDEDDEVDRPDHQQEHRRDRRPDEAADLLEPREVADEARRDGDQDRQGDDDRRVPEREEQPHRNRALAVLHQLAGRVVDRGDMVGIDRMAQAEGVGQEGGRQQDRVLARHQQRQAPGAEVEHEQEGVDADDPVPEGARSLDQPERRGEHRASYAGSVIVPTDATSCNNG